MSDVAEDEHVVAAARLVGAAEPNEPEPSGPGPTVSERSGREPNHPGGGDPNEPESCDGIGPMLGGADRG